MRNLLISVYQQSGRTYSQHDVHSFGVLGGMQIDTVHCQFLGIFKVMQLGFRWGLTPTNRNLLVTSSEIAKQTTLLVRLVQIHHFVQQLWRLVRRNLEILQILAILHLVRIVIAQLRLD